MSYQVLARKWRPKNFQELRGQEHVSRALVNAIESGRLHHAYLFTGTRGVGKTTIARILSKCLNCEAEGVTATPCGQCGSCSEIDEGRFVDLIEVDAASRTKVDDTRELLENVQYRPTRGRYKVYLIDEVHMLSNSSFNALLKTLEEPPEHVIFLLATTDPQKLPVTVLSRCLQFHLKHMDEETIANHLTFILEQESLDFEEPALHLIAQSAEGSMRDALSLLDQAIAYGQGKVLEEDIRTMLGTIDHKFMVRLLEALASKDSVMAIKAIDDMSHYPVDFADALKELLSRIHQIAVYQATQVMLDTAASYVPEFADIFDAADLQMYYQLGLHARRDLEWAPTAKQGLEMALLRMLAFQIDSGSDQGQQAPKKKVSLNQPSQSEASSSSVAKEPLTNRSEAESSTSDKPQTEVSEQKDVHASDVKKQSLEQAQPPEQSADDEFSGYEQFIQQEEQGDHDEEDAVSFAFSDSTESKASSITEQPSADLQKDSENTVAEQSSSSQESENDDALASLHSALGLSFGNEPSASSQTTKPKQEEAKEDATLPAEDATNIANNSEPSADQEPVKEHPEQTSPSGGEVTNSKPIQNKPTESYDSDIERMMQASNEPDNSPEPLNDGGNSGAASMNQFGGADEPEEPAFVPELNVPEEALEWANLVQKLELDGTYHQIAQSSCAIWSSDQNLVLELSPDQEILLTDSAKSSVKSALDSFLGKSITIDWQLKEPSIDTPAQIWQHQAKLRLQKACEDLNQHPFSQQLQQQFGAKIDRESVTYLDD